MLQVDLLSTQNCSRFRLHLTNPLPLISKNQAAFARSNYSNPHAMRCTSIYFVAVLSASSVSLAAILGTAEGASDNCADPKCGYGFYPKSCWQYTDRYEGNWCWSGEQISCNSPADCKADLKCYKHKTGPQAPCLINDP